MSRHLAALLLLGTLLTSGRAHAQDTAPSTSTSTSTSTSPSTSTSTSTSTSDVAVEPTVAPAATERIPKVAIVIAGDPDPSTLAAAHALEDVLAVETHVTMPSDQAVRAALRGEGSADGLDELRAERRRLGLGEARDVTVLTVLGELASADLVLVVRSAHGATQASAFDVLRRSFYDGVIALEPIDVAEATHFVARRARRAARPLDPGETHTVPTPPPVVDPATAVPPEAIAADPETPAHEPDFFEQYWPYFAAGALLIGAVVFIVLTTTSSSTPPPVLRFEVGGGS